MGEVHTPWSLRQDSENPLHPGWFVDRADGRAICWCRDESKGRMIAAAPDMLAALYQYVSDLRYPPQGDSIQRRIERAEAAIAKATGKAEPR